MNNFLAALALLFIIEGLILFSLPNKLESILKYLLSVEKKKIRILGFFSIMLGLVLLGLNQSYL